MREAAVRPPGMDPKGCQHITKVVWSKLICQAKRCAVILQSLVTEVVSNLPGSPEDCALGTRLDVVCHH